MAPELVPAEAHVEHMLATDAGQWTGAECYNAMAPGMDGTLVDGHPGPWPGHAAEVVEGHPGPWPGLVAAAVVPLAAEAQLPPSSASATTVLEEAPKAEQAEQPKKDPEP